MGWADLIHPRGKLVGVCEITKARGGGAILLGFVAAFVVLDAGESERAGAVRGEDVIGAILGHAVIENVFVLAIGDGGAGVEQRAVLVGEKVLAIAALDDAGKEFGHAAGAVGKETDTFVIQCGGGVVEE